MDHAVAGDVLHRVWLRSTYFAGLADDHAELDFPVGLLRAARDLDVVVRADDGRGRLHEDDRLGRHRHAGFRGVIGVVQADADELADAGDARAEPRRAVDARQRRRIDLPQARRASPAAARRRRGPGSTPDRSRMSPSRRAARVSRARRAVSEQFHSSRESSQFTSPDPVQLHHMSSSHDAGTGLALASDTSNVLH